MTITDATFHERLQAHELKSLNNFYFRCKHLPPAFAKEVLDGTGNSSILLVSEKKTWLVRCICRKRGASFTSGWRKFAEDNDLKVGDACVFEVPERINTAWEVIIFRGWQIIFHSFSSWFEACNEVACINLYLPNNLIYIITY